MHAGDERGAGGDQRSSAWTTSPPPRNLPVPSCWRAEDERVQHDDVGHREEGDEAAADLAADGRAALGDLEEPVESAGWGHCRPWPSQVSWRKWASPWAAE